MGDSLAILTLHKNFGVEQKVFLEELTTITAAFIDMHKAGVTGSTALATLKAAFRVDPSLEELTTITAAMIDLKESGLTEAEAMARLEAALIADPTLETLDDLLELPKEREDDKEDPKDSKERDDDKEDPKDSKERDDDRKDP